jgi:hypothetical protein
MEAGPSTIEAVQSMMVAKRSLKGLLILPYTGGRGGWVGGSVKREDSHEGKLEDLYRSRGHVT